MTDGALAESGLDEVLRLLSARTGLAFRPDQRAKLSAAVLQVMRRTASVDLRDYAARIARDGEALDELVSEVTVGETFFFREPKQFRFIRSTILPDIRQRRGAGHILVAWSAGCASGEEPYSLAMLFHREGWLQRSRVLATDICRRALAKAREGMYQGWSLRGEGKLWARRYLTFDGECYRLDPRIAGRVRFEYLNLALDVYPSIITGTRGVDLILCRNVLIYLDRDTINSVIRRLFASLAPGGWLLTSSADPPIGRYAPLETVTVEGGVYYRRPSATPRRLSVSSPRPASPPRKTALPTPATAVEQAGQDVPEATVASDPAGPGHRHSELAVAGRNELRTPAAAVAEVIPSPLAQARAALEQGHYRLAAEVTEPLRDPAALAVHVQALANLDGSAARAACAEAVQRHPLVTELHYLHASLLLESGQYEAAAHAARRLIFLDRSLAIGHFLLGSILRRGGDLHGARRCFRNARDLCELRPAEEPLPLSDGQSAGQLAEAARLQLDGLETEEDAS